MTLEQLVPLNDYVPPIYKDCQEMEELVKSEDSVFSTFINTTNTEYSRMFIQTSDETGVARKEYVMKITADPSIESLQFRKERLLTRSNSTLPYSTIWLRNYLNSVLGEYNYELDIDYENRKIQLHGYTLNYNWAKEASNVIMGAKPCNMIFVNIPTVIESLGVFYWDDDDTWNSDVWNDNNFWMDYKLLTPSEMPDYERDTDQTNLFSLYQDVSYIQFNNTETQAITSKTITNNSVIITMTVPETITLLEDIKILDSFGSVITHTTSYISTPSGTQMEFRLACYHKKEI